MIRVLIADESRQVTDNISRRLALEDDIEVCGTAGEGEYAVQQSLWLKPDIAIVDAALPGLDGVQTTVMLAQALPATGVILMSMEAENDAYRQAMLAGVREFLQKPFKGDDLVAAVRRVHAFGQRRNVSAARAGSATAASPAAADDGAAVGPTRQRTRGVVTAVISGKGGVGKTVVAINLAAALGEIHRGEVVLVDLSLQFGDIAAALNLPTTHSITDLVSDSGVTDADAVRQVLASGPAGISVLLAPTSPELADYVQPADITSLVETLRGSFEHIVLDTPSYLNDATISSFEVADHIVMLTDLSVTGVKNARLTRSALETLNIDPSKVVVVANHRESAGELDRHGAETFLGAHISTEIPFAADVVATSVNKGVPFVISQPTSPPSVAIRAVVELIDPVSQSGSDTTPDGESSDKKRKTRRKLSFSR